MGRRRMRHPGKQAAEERMARALATGSSRPPTARAAGSGHEAGGAGPSSRDGWPGLIRHPVILGGVYAWAVIGVLVLAVATMVVAAELRLVLVPALLALFPAALLSPATSWLRRRGFPGGLAAVASLLGSIALLVLVGQFIVARAIAEAPRLAESVVEGWEDLQAFLETGPLGMDPQWLRDSIESARQAVLESDIVRTGVLGAATAVAEIVAMLLLLLVILFFFLKDGDRIARWLRDLFPAAARNDIEQMGMRAWATITAYIRGQLIVALVDGVFIGIGLAILGVPLALPLGVLVFFGGLFPIVGAVITGILAVLVALADGGPVVALIALAIVVAVQQLESNVLAPMVLGKATALHPLAVLTSLTAGGILLGVLGAFIAVPITASLVRGIGYLRRRPRAPATT